MIRGAARERHPPQPRGVRPDAPADRPVRRADAIADTGDITDGVPTPRRPVRPDRHLDVPSYGSGGNHDPGSTQQAVAQPQRGTRGSTATAPRWPACGSGASATPATRPTRASRWAASPSRSGPAPTPPSWPTAWSGGEPPAADVALVHDARMAEDLGGRAAGAGRPRARVSAWTPSTRPREDEDGGEDGEETGGTTTTEATTTTRRRGARRHAAAGGGPTRWGRAAGAPGGRAAAAHRLRAVLRPDTDRLLADGRHPQDGKTGATIERHIVGQTPFPRSGNGRRHPDGRSADRDALGPQSVDGSGSA